MVTVLQQGCTVWPQWERMCLLWQRLEVMGGVGEADMGEHPLRGEGKVGEFQLRGDLEEGRAWAVNK